MAGVDPLNWLTIKINHSHCVCVTVQGLLPEVELFPAVSGAYWSPPFGVLLMRLVELSSNVV